jgi:hypothetical protein
MGMGKGQSLYAICFCAGDDVLTQWRGYSPAGGCAIGVDFKELKHKAKDGFVLGKMLYDRDKQREIIKRIMGCVRRLRPRVLKAGEPGAEDLDVAVAFVLAFMLCLFSSALQFKHPALSSEDEWRLFTPNKPDNTRFRARGNAIIPYIELPFEPSLITQIRRSPGVWSRSAAYGVERLAKSLGGHVVVDESDLPL